jgi:pyruvate,orthophosphate dikinase
MFATDSVEDPTGVTDQLTAAMQGDLEQLLAEMDGLPVTVRLLDVPLDRVLGDADVDRPGAPYDAALGVRGARALLVHPGLLRLQVQAAIGAVGARLDPGGDPKPRLMVPFVALAAELVMIRQLIDAVAAESDRGIEIPVGVMIETPRAAVTAADLVGSADFVLRHERSDPADLRPRP